jgi:stearoyl-CoA desaturase (delta-9 desaturase)
MHHKFAETDADPHNPLRGFFFAHCGWILKRKHPEVILKAQKINFNHIMDDPVVSFQHKYYVYLYLSLAMILPILIPCYFWGELIYNSFLIAFVGRYMNILHTTLLINSWGHMFGCRTYTHSVRAGDMVQVMNTLTIGEGYHNFHHAFPFDYRSSEDGIMFNTTKALIDLGALIGQVYDRKTLPAHLIEARKERVRRCKHS